MNFKVENWKVLVLSVFYVIFAVISYMVKKEQFLNFFMIAGLIVAVVGLLQIMAYFFKKEYMKPNEFSFAFGVLYVVAGLIVATNPDVIVDNYPLVLSGVVVLDSTLRLQYSMNLFRLEKEAWEINAILAAVPLVLGVVLILVPMSEDFMHNYFSFLLILDAIANFYTILYYKRIVKEFERKGYALVEDSLEE
ncbi:DUF308 domain-containing protein [Amedibacillus dolichus]|uniref:DUF308 domain-containing protein n=1 Tax=Amedibacillus dolichus TaxID=31971 RepID=A0A415PR57_9FIRM|nr:DUF308 domain-containing protein [Amedibacillus dolichus]RHM15241.1 DUF308 domain-containing protein [Amedibacillus dolichus]